MEWDELMGPEKKGRQKKKDGGASGVGNCSTGMIWASLVVPRYLTLPSKPRPRRRFNSPNRAGHSTPPCALVQIEFLRLVGADSPAPAAVENSHFCSRAAAGILYHDGAAIAALIRISRVQGGELC